MFDTDEKLTDNEIPDIKELLEYKAKVGCQNCDLIGKGCCSTCVNSLIKSFIELFNRLQAENERLKLELADTKRDLQIVLDNSISAKLPHCVLCGKGAILTKSLKEYDELISDISAEAYKEFAERLKKHSYFDHKDQRKIVAEVIIDHYLKELVGEDNASTNK